jgi:two-component system response regulator AdeR
VADTRPVILIADDNVDTREMYALYLSMLDYKVEEAADGREALIKARTLRPDLIVMDLQMPKLDGWGAIRELQSRDATVAIPVIVLTGHDFKAFLKPAALAAGAVSYLMKPCFPDQLAREISTRLTADRTRRVAGIRR